jgi:hypothetical protein
MFAGYAMKYYDDEGNYNGPVELDERDRMRTACNLLDHGGEKELKLAEKLINTVFVKDGKDLTELSLEDNFLKNAASGAQTMDWNIFQSNYASKALAMHADRVSPKIKARLERMTIRNFSRYAGSAQGDYFPRGYNDNMPAEGMAGLILGGEFLKNEQAVQDGLYHLELFAEQLSRCGMIAEHSSGTYLPLTIAALAEIAEHSQNPDTRELALKIEVQLWADVVMFYHLKTGKFANASTRSYTVNSVGHVDSLAVVMWLASGYPHNYCPVDFAYPGKENQVTHFSGDRWKTFCGRANLHAPFHFPEYLHEVLKKRKYPFNVSATSECEGLEGEKIISRGWQMPNCAMATATSPFLDGSQSESFYLAYANKDKPVDFADSGVIYTRYLFNDTVPGELAEGPLKGESNLLRNRGVVRAVQDNGTAMVVSRAWNAPSVIGNKKDELFSISKLAQVIIIPQHFFELEECRIGDEKVTEFPAESVDATPVFLNLGRAYAVFYPLTLTKLARKAAVRIEKVNRYLTISFINYEGEEKDFSIEDLHEVFNGFSCDLKDAEEAGSFDEFCKSWDKGQIEDWWFSNCRRTRIRKNNTELAISWITPTNRLKFVTINGRQIEQAPFKASGFDEKLLPLLAEPYTDVRFSPPDALDVAWWPAKSQVME